MAFSFLRCENFFSTNGNDCDIIEDILCVQYCSAGEIRFNSNVDGIFEPYTIDILMTFLFKSFSLFNKKTSYSAFLKKDQTFVEHYRIA